MRRKRSTEVQSSFFASAVVHGGLVLLLFWTRNAPGDVVPESLEVYSVDPAQLEALEPKLPQQAAAVPPIDPSMLSEDQLKALTKDPEPLPEHVPSPDAVAKARGQIVELADPLKPQEAPADAQYLARADHRVEQETAAMNFRVNPEVVAPTFSAESSLAHPNAGDVKARLEGDAGGGRGQAGRADGEKVASLPSKGERQEASEAMKQEAAKEPPAPKPAPGQPLPEKETLAENGDIQAKQETKPVLPPSPLMAKLNPALRPSALRDNPLLPGHRDEDGEPNGSTRRVALVPERVRYGTGDGGGENGTSPVSVQQGELKGAPSNDRLNERRGDSTMLNAREFKYHSYMNLIRRQVNFYWDQALQNIGQPREKLSRNEYTTVLRVVVDKKGNLKSVAMIRGCGVKVFDEATVQAFRLASPFPAPPPGMLDGDQAEMPDFGFSLMLSREQPQYSAIDPRSHVLFPGIIRPQ